MNPPMRVLVVGTSSGIGQAVASHLVKRGDHVVGIARRAHKIAASGTGQFVGWRRDMRDPEQRSLLLQQAIAELDGLDAIVYCAGVAHHAAPGKITETQLAEQWEVNCVAPMRLFEQAVLTLENAALLAIGSTLSLRPIATSTAYSASKAALTAACKALAITGAARNVRVNVLSLGVVDTPMVANRDLRALGQMHLLGAVGRADDVAVFVGSIIRQPWMTGSDLLLDGGLMLGGCQ